MHSIFYSAALTIQMLLQGSTYGKLTEGGRLSEEDSCKLLDNLSFLTNPTWGNFKWKWFFISEVWTVYVEAKSILFYKLIKSGAVNTALIHLFMRKILGGWNWQDAQIDIEGDTKMMSRVPVSSGKWNLNDLKYFLFCVLTDIFYIEFGSALKRYINLLGP